MAPTPQLIVASASPRRREMLRDLTTTFIATNIDEAVLPDETPAGYVARVSAAKAKAAQDLCEAESVILGADTCVVLDEHILGKPVSEANAADMLASLSGREHQVLTGVAVVDAAGELHQCVVTTIVTFGHLGSSDIDWYVATGEPMDKAGAYGIQGSGGLFVERVNGSVSNVIGLPLLETYDLLRRAGLDVASLRCHS